VRLPALGDGVRRDVLHLALLFTAFVVVDRLLASFATLPPDRLFSPVLMVQAGIENRLAFTLMLLAAGSVAFLGYPRTVARWDALDHGSVLRAFGSIITLWLAWRASAYHFNYVLDAWHGLDRMLVVALAMASVARPIFLLPFVAEVRVVNGQFAYPLGTTFGQTFDEMLLIVLIVLGCAYVLHVATGRRDSSAVLLVWSTVVAAHLFEPGRAKLAMGWLTQNDMSLLAPNSYIAGWLGRGSGLYAQSLGRLMGEAGWLLKVGTLGMELGGIVAVLHPRMLRLWLPVVAVFHGVTFAATGFLFFDWAAFELALCVILWTPELRPWVHQNATPARAVFAATAVLFGAPLYHPARLAWFDAPVAYGYEVEAIASDGTEQGVPLSMFAPFEQEMMFMRADFVPLSLPVSGYGATSSPEVLSALRRLGDIGELESLETEVDPTVPFPDSLSTRLITSFFQYVRSTEPAGIGLPSAPSRFWSGGGEPEGRGDTVIEALRVVLVASLTIDGSQQVRRTPVLTVARAPDGTPRVERLAPETGR
jgi:hypothetical protein